MDYISGRHAGMVEVIRVYLPDAVHAERFDTDVLQAGDRVFGTLPYNLAAEVCARDAKFFAFIYDQSGLSGGEELTADMLRERGARFVQFHVEAIHGHFD